MRPLLTAVGRALVTPFLVLVLTGCISTVHVQPYEARTPIRVSAPVKTIGMNRIISNIPSGKAA